MSNEADCAAERSCFPTAGRIKQKDAWIAKHDLFVSGGRAYALVDTDKHVYFMDAVTGSLYQFGNCLSSSQSDISNVERDKDKAVDILMVNHHHERDPVGEEKDE